jgi:hypothetical protein
MSLTFKATGSQAVPVDFPVRWSGFFGARTSSSAEPAAYANTTRFGVAQSWTADATKREALKTPATFRLK